MTLKEPGPANIHTYIYRRTVDSCYKDIMLLNLNNNLTDHLFDIGKLKGTRNKASARQVSFILAYIFM